MGGKKMNNKRILFLLLFLSVICLSLSCFSFNLLDEKKAQALDSKYYQCTLNVEESVLNATTNITTNTSLYGVTEIKFGRYLERTFKLFIYEENASSTILGMGEYIGLNTFNITAYSSVLVATGSGVKTRILSSSLKNLRTGAYISQKTTSSITQPGDSSVYSGSLDDGEYEIKVVWYVEDRDSNGNNGTKLTAEVTSRFGVDRVSPSYTCNEGSTYLSSSYGKGDIEYYVMDETSGLDRIVYTTPGGNSVTVDTNGSSEYLLTIPSTSDNGLYSFISYDVKGNSTTTHYVYLDTSPPNLSFKYNGVNLENYTNLPFSIETIDSGSGIEEIKYQVSGSSYINYNSSTFSSNLVNGIYHFVVRDRAGNVTEKSIVYDTISPTISVKSGGVNIANGDVVPSGTIVTVEPLDNLAGVNSVIVFLPSSFISSVTGPITLTDSGSYIFYVSDNCGNISSGFAVSVDSSPPSLTSTTGDFFIQTSNDFTVTISDSLSSSYLYVKTPLDSDYVLQNTNSYTVTTLKSNGKYYFYGVDSMGNTSSIYWIELTVGLPVANVVYDDENNRYKFVWDDNSVGYLNGDPYTMGTWIYDEGYYTLVLTNENNRSDTFTLTIGHKYQVFLVIEPTCSENGYTVNKCVNCGDTYVTNIVPATGHNYEYEYVTENCTMGRHKHYICTKCGDEYDGEEESDPYHDYVIDVINPTCSQRGYSIYTCSICGNIFVGSYTEALGHNIVEEIIDASCEEEGKISRHCSRCNDYVEVIGTIPALGHNYEGEEVLPTCVEGGYLLHRCSRCGKEYKTDEKMPLNHFYIDEVIEKTCTSDGMIRHKCARCGEYYDTDVSKSKGHDFVSEILKVASCTEDGIRHFVCTKCGYEKEEVIRSFGHDYEVYDEMEESGDILRRRVCKSCGEERVEILESKYESVANYIVYLFDEYSPYMWPIFGGTASIWSIFMGISIVMATRSEEKQKAKKMIFSYLIGLVVIGVILVAAPYLAYGIASLF